MLVQIAYFMKGSVSLLDAYDLSPDQRNYIFELANENAEAIKARNNQSK